MISTKNVHLLAFDGNGLSIVPTRTLNFGGACAKPFAKIHLLVPTNKSTHGQNLLQHSVERACNCLAVQHSSFVHGGPQRANPTHNRVQIWRSWLQHTSNDGRRINHARIRDGQHLAMPTQLRNGSFASLQQYSKRVAQLSRTPDTKKNCQPLSKQHRKKSPNLCAQRHLFYPTVKLDRNLWPSVCGRRHPHTISKVWLAWTAKPNKPNQWKTPPSLCNLLCVFRKDEDHITALHAKKNKNACQIMFASLLITQLKVVARLRFHRNQ